MKLVTHTQGSDAWKLWRRGGLGGSDVATVLGLSPFEDATLENLVREKVEGWERPVSFVMRRGNLWEPRARAAYERRCSCSAPPVCVEHDDAPWMRVSLDGLCSNHAVLPSERRRWILELKVPNVHAHTAALAGVVPSYYRPQCQWQLLVTGLDRLDYASYSENRRYGGEPTPEQVARDELGDRLAIVRVLPDPELQAEILERAEAFWLGEIVPRLAVQTPELAAAM